MGSSATPPPHHLHGQMTLFSPSLKLLLEENCKCCHRSGPDLLTLGSQQPLPTHKQHWAKWGWALGWGSSVRLCLCMWVCSWWSFVPRFWTKIMWGQSERYYYLQNKPTTRILYIYTHCYIKALRSRAGSRIICKCVVWMRICERLMRVYMAGCFSSLTASSHAYLWHGWRCRLLVFTENISCPVCDEHRRTMSRSICIRRCNNLYNFEFMIQIYILWYECTFLQTGKNI